MFYQPRNKYVKPGFVHILFFFFTFFIPKVAMKMQKKQGIMGMKSILNNVVQC